MYLKYSLKYMHLKILPSVGLGRGLSPCQVSLWSIQPFGNKTPTLQTERQDRTMVQ